LDKGLSHGFLGASLDFRSLKNDKISNGRKEWEEVFPASPLNLLKQESADKIETVEGVYSREEPPVADAWLLALDDIAQGTPQGRSFGILTADCVPAILVNFPERSLALIHLGWRGVALDLFEKCLSQMANPSDCQLALGPSCSGAAYEVEGWVHNRVSGHDNFAEKEKTFLDLPAIISERAHTVGLAPENVYLSNLCTIGDERFFSYRRQKDLAGRQLSFVGGKINS